MVGNCRYCHAKAGMFKDAHEACETEAASARTALATMVADAITLGRTGEQIRPEVNSLAQKGRLSDFEVRSVLLKAADAAALAYAHESPISNDEAERLGNLFVAIDADWFQDPTQLVKWHGYLSLVYSNTLYEVLHKETPYYDPSLRNAFRLSTDEHPILQRNATLAEYRTVHRGNNYQSVSVPVGGGIYFRVGASQPRAGQTGLVPVDQGLMLLSTQAIYFGGEQSSFRIPYSQILRLESFVDGFGVHENHGRGKVFIPALLGSMDEGWYFYNLVSALMNW